MNCDKKKTVRIWARQRNLYPEGHLGTEFTRYAHFYPQILWKTPRDVHPSLLAKPCWARVAREPGDASGMAAGDGPNPTG
jgi:hypothetical protein